MDEKRSRVGQLEEAMTRRANEVTEVREQLVKARESAELARSNLIDLRELIVVYEKEKAS